MREEMGQKLYLECNSGISGDMTVAALLDLGADQEALRQALESLPLSGFEIEIRRVKKAGLDVCDFLVRLDHEHENHDHDMEYLHGHHTVKEHVHNHEHRGLKEIGNILARTEMTEGARVIACRIFDILAQAEAKAHGVDVSEVHFHEVGAVDSVVDIAAAAVCLDNLGVTEVIVPYVCEGRGTVRCQHGVLPVPVPAVVNIVQEYGLLMRITDVEGELVTPTGAAIAAAVRTSAELPERFFVRRVGMGAGKREYETSGILRAMLIE